MPNLKFLLLLFLLLPLVAVAEEPNLVINEIAWMGTAISASDEWLELHNLTDEEVDLSGWRLEAADASPKINLAGTIPADGYFLLERTDDDTVAAITADQIYTGALSNTSEWLKLYDADNNLIDQINATDGWPAGDNTTKQTLERASIIAWQNSLEPGGTPKAKNSTTTAAIEEEPAETETPSEETDADQSMPPTDPTKAEKGDIIINEIFPDPAGPDTAAEFIEIKNVSAKDVDLTDWKITNYAKQAFIIPSLKMTPKSIVVFYRTQTQLALNNSKDKVTLYNASGRIIDQVEYKSPAIEDESYQKTSEAKLVWDLPSPGQDNAAEILVLPVAIIDGPKAAAAGDIITFDASDSFDPKNRPLNFFWDFGDGRKAAGLTARQIYLQPGSYEIALNALVDQNSSSTEKFKIKISGETADQQPNQPTTTPTTTLPLTTPAEIPFIFIAEFLPNPEGSDDQEFIEIFSNHHQPVNLAGWQLDDAEGGSKPYTIGSQIIKPGQYLVFWRSETKIALNNSDETVRLFAPDNTLVDSASYEESKEGASFVLTEDFSWQQTSTPTPGEINVLNQELGIMNQESGQEQPEILGAATQEVIENNEGQGKGKYIFSAVSAAVILGVGTILKIKKKAKHGT